MIEDEPRPLPARLDPRLGRPAPQADERAPRGRGTRRAVVVARALAALMSVVVLAGSGWGWYLTGIAEASLNRTDAIPTDGNSDVNGRDHAGSEMNLLLVGMDSRTGLTREQQAEFSTGDPDDVLNTDSMMLVHVPADGSGASFVSLPRDTYVPIPGHGQAKLNSAYVRGYNEAEGSEGQKDAAGAGLLIKTVSQFTGLQIDHFAKLDLLGFVNLSTIVGGVEVNLCEATRDSYSGADFEAGVQTISGGDALKFVRQRHGLDSDLDRVVRQQVYLAGMLRNILSSDLLLDPGKQKALVEQVGSSVTLDAGLDVYDLAAQMQGVQPGDITFQTIPGLTDRKADGADVLQPPAPDVVRAFFGDLGSGAASAPAAPTTPAPGLDPEDVTVAVQNGSGVSGAAATAATALTAAGFAASSDGNATRTATTTVSHPTGDEAGAALVAAQVPGAAVAVDDALPAGTVQLVIGTDYNGIGTPVTAPVAAPPSDDSYATVERTATDASCIY
ncbi:LytR family transcriptional regulator [Modestobacter sp. I12A-02628]|uniref:LCP family protein n=1 Tax=Goekera deserti TaxID=2497753 RepID=A0A7K3WJG6_9ACTN|nr:LytR family transcriptional regulator [Goekera deserti]NDI50369.1 LytR family transcriptional regulator [Goekera deserti]NEL55673.1 LCP family protein [Goekera deserti]